MLNRVQTALPVRIPYRPITALYLNDILNIPIILNVCRKCICNTVIIRKFIAQRRKEVYTYCCTLRTMYFMLEWSVSMSSDYFAGHYAFSPGSRKTQC